ncbi:MAG TPA: hypothetical protein VF493_16980 [Terriglobales bacterium]
MSDMSKVIIPKSDQLNADDLIAGPITIKISGVDIRGGQEQPVSIRFEGGNGKPYKACKSMCRIMVAAWGADASKYVGRSMTLYRDAKVKWAGLEVGGIRISHMSDIGDDMTMALTVTRQNRKPFTVKPLKKLDEHIASIGKTTAAPQESTVMDKGSVQYGNAPAGTATISDEQESTLLDLIAAAGMELKHVLQHQDFKLKSLRDLPQSRYQELAERLKAKAQEGK